MNKKKDSDKREPQTIDGETGTAEPTPRRIDLSSLKDVRIELAHIYRQMDAGSIATADGTKRAYVLKTIADIIALAELERRIAELEERQGLALPNGAPVPASRQLN